MESKHPVAEGFAIGIGLGIFVGYHFWFFVLKGLFVRKDEQKYYGINGKGKIARVLFTQLVSNSKSGVLGVQQNRNAMMGASFQASIAAIFFNELLDILVSPAKIRTLQKFSVSDPFLRDSTLDAEAPIDSENGFENSQIGLVTALAVIIINLAIILTALLFFVVCVRLTIHSGYYYKAVGHEHQIITVADCLRLTLQQQAVYTIGQRLIFFFPITAMWFLGPTAMLCTSVVVTTGVAVLDRWDPRNPHLHVDRVLKYDAASSTRTAQQSDSAA